MNNINLFSDAEYEALKSAYNNILHSNSAECLSYLNGILKVLENNNFQMPLTLQNEILADLSQAKQILGILCVDNVCSNLNLNGNIFTLLFYLSHLSSLLNSHTIKSANQILHLKTNNLIINCINKISKYFKNKNLKLFKFI